MTKKSKEKIKYPATCVVHWPTGPVNCCEKHARGLIMVGNHLGSHIVATKIEKPAECKNCVNENRLKGEKSLKK